MTLKTPVTKQHFKEWSNMIILPYIVITLTKLTSLFTNQLIVNYKIIKDLPFMAFEK